MQSEEDHLAFLPAVPLKVTSRPIAICLSCLCRYRSQFPCFQCNVMQFPWIGFCIVYFWKAELRDLWTYSMSGCCSTNKQWLYSFSQIYSFKWHAPPQKTPPKKNHFKKSDWSFLLFLVVVVLLTVAHWSWELNTRQPKKTCMIWIFFSGYR